MKKNISDKNKIEVRVDKELRDIVPDFLEHKKQDCLDMLKALKMKDYEFIRLHGHSIRGTGGSYGFKRITEIGEKIEALALELEKNSKQLEKNSKQLEREIAELSSYLEKVNVTYSSDSETS